MTCRAVQASTPGALTLPSYAEDMAGIFAGMPSPPPSTCRRAIPVDVAQFLDVEAAEADASEEYST
jgi:hypothetical protein